jgi:hypothetical protein
LSPASHRFDRGSELDVQADPADDGVILEARPATALIIAAMLRAEVDIESLDLDGDVIRESLLKTATDRPTPHPIVERPGAAATDGVACIPINQS